MSRWGSRPPTEAVVYPLEGAKSIDNSAIRPKAPARTRCPPQRPHRHNKGRILLYLLVCKAFTLKPLPQTVPGGMASRFHPFGECLARHTRMYPPHCYYAGVGLCSQLVRRSLVPPTVCAPCRGVNQSHSRSPAVPSAEARTCAWRCRDAKWRSSGLRRSRRRSCQAAARGRPDRTRTRRRRQALP